MEIAVNGQTMWHREATGSVQYWDMPTGFAVPPDPVAFDTDDATVTFSFVNHVKFYGVGIEVRLDRLGTTLTRWQQSVWNKVVAEEQKAINDQFAQDQLDYALRIHLRQPARPGTAQRARLSNRRPERGGQQDRHGRGDQEALPHPHHPRVRH